MNRKRIVPLIAALLLFAGCRHAAGSPAFTSETAAPSTDAATFTDAAPPEPAQTPGPPAFGAAGAALIPLPGEDDECDLALITAEYTGRDDGLFAAAYRALTETVWTDVHAALARVGDYLPAGEQGSISIAKLPFDPLKLGEGEDSAGAEITRSVDEQTGLAAIEIRLPGYERFVMVFDIGEDGAYLPVFGVMENTHSWEWRFERLGNARFFVRVQDSEHGTGIWVRTCEWYNVLTVRREIRYHDGVGEASSWCPLGWWTFRGYLSEPRVTELPGGKSVLLEMDVSYSLGREDADGAFRAPHFKLEKTGSVRIRYDLAQNRAYAEGGLARWYFTASPRLYAAPFARELAELSRGDNDVNALWAKWMLEGAPCWEDFFAENGIAFEEESPIR